MKLYTETSFIYLLRHFKLHLKMYTCSYIIVYLFWLWILCNTYLATAFWYILIWLYFFQRKHPLGKHYPMFRNETKQDPAGPPQGKTPPLPRRSTRTVVIDPVGPPSFPQSLWKSTSYWARGEKQRIINCFKLKKKFPSDDLYCPLYCQRPGLDWPMIKPSIAFYNL